MNKLKYVGYLFIGFAALIVLLGLSTYLWVPINTKVSSLNKKNICIAGYSNVARPGAQQVKSGICNYVSVDYHYTVNEKFYSKKFIGFYIPVNIHLEPVGDYKNSTAYYLPMFPEISVIKRGFGWALTLILLFLGYFCFFIRKLILNYLTKLEKFY